MPIARGWGSGGLQVTLATIGPGDTLKVIDQGTDAGVNAVNIRRLVERTAPGVTTTYSTDEATIIQSRHRFPEEPLRADQIMVLQVPLPEPLRMVEPRESVTRQLHAEADYARMWVHLYEDVITNGEISRAAGYPVMVNGRYVMSPSPIPRWDIDKLHQSQSLTLLGAGREKRIYAVPPHTDVVPLDFEDHPFRVEDFTGQALRPLRRGRHLPGRDHRRGRRAGLCLLGYGALRPEDCGLRIADCGLGVSTCHRLSLATTPIRNPQSAIRNGPIGC